MKLLSLANLPLAQRRLMLRLNSSWIDNSWHTLTGAEWRTALALAAKKLVDIQMNERVARLSTDGRRVIARERANM